MRYFREKLQCRNVTLDVKHFEDCEQLFVSVGRCLTIEALVHFFNMENKDGRIVGNRPPYHLLDVGDNKKEYYNSVLDKFIDEFLFLPTPVTVDGDDDQCSIDDNEDFVKNYSLCLLKYYFIFLDLKDATLHEELLPHFKSIGGFNAYAIEMLISIVQNEVFLSEAHQCIWASTANWRGGPSKNIEIDLLQENQNRVIKNEIKVMSPNKTDKAIERSSRSSGGERQRIQNFDYQVNRIVHSSSHSHRSSAIDEGKVIADLRLLKPLNFVPGRKHDSFEDIMADPLATFDEQELNKWLRRHKKNLLLDAPLGNDEEDES